MVKIPLLKKGDVVAVEWNDAWGRTGWLKPEDVIGSSPFSVRTVSMYLGRNKGGDVILAASVDRQGLVNDVNGIPHKMITKIRKINVV